MSDWKFNPFTGQLDSDTDTFRGVLATEPENPQNGWRYLNSENHTLYIYYNSSWQVLHVLHGVTVTTSTIGVPMGILLSQTYAFNIWET